MPKADILQRQGVATVFKRAVACDEVGADDFEKTTEVETLEMIWRNGWLHAKKTNYGVRYIFPSSIHCWWAYIPVRFTFITEKPWF